jgi:hypothetical protein
MSALPVTVGALEERLIGVHALWRRTPGGGQSPFARDIPAHLMLRDRAAGDIVGEYSETLLVNEAGKELLVRKIDERAPRSPLRAAEVAERELVTGWLGLLLPEGFEQLAEAKQRDAVLTVRVVWLATAQLARGEDRPQWSEIRRVTGAKLTPRSLAWRYTKALAVLLCRLHGVQVRHAKAIAAGSAALLHR